MRHVSLLTIPLSFVPCLLLSACSTFSFAPPTVQTEFKLAASSSLCGPRARPTAEITKDFRGARSLIDNFTIAYRCSVQEAADGRQIFEVPSFLALVTAAIGPTFGLSNDGRIAAISGASVYGRANSYYAPREKLPALDAALDAVICVKSESIGVPFFDTRQGDAEAVRTAIRALQGQITPFTESLVLLEAKRAVTVAELAKLEAIADASAAARASLLADLKLTETVIALTKAELEKLAAALGKIVDTGATRLAASPPLGIAGVDDLAVVASANEQYFELVSGSLLSIERILGARLKSAGKFDPAGLQAEIGKTLTEMQEADNKTRQTPLRGLGDQEKGEEVRLRVQALQPKLQNCVVRAKLG